ncbi:MAG: benzoate-CoA ligase family protein [Chloroflexaceae bacterium]|jgi:benzoate-CoA ligase family protein|nr:benzoate-CoA ligase family protein [Chloroflexaceae bacterium]
MHLPAIPTYYNAVEILERNLPERAGKVALYSAARCLSFGEVAAEVNQVGHALKALGIRFGDYVAILAPDSPEWVTVFFATLKIGAVHVGLNTLLKPQEYAYMLRDSRTRALVVHQALLPAILEIREQLPQLEHVIVIGDDVPEGSLRYADWISGQPTELAAEATHRDDICTLNYSSGTTGDPKGIPHAHKDLPLTAQLWGVNVLGLREDDRTFATAKLFFTFGTGGNLLFPWYVGASCILLAGPPRVAANVLNTIQQFQPTILYNAPTSYAALLAMENLGDYDFSSLRLCVSAGESLPAPIWQGWKERTGLDIIDGIGCTEIYHIFISNRPGDMRPGSSGKPVPGFEVKLMDDAEQEVAAGDIGNLWVKGPTTALFYLHQYEKSRRTFRGEWLVTGDKYRVDEDGYYWHCGRSDDMLKVGGIWVAPTEVESTLLRHNAVLECAVIGMNDGAGLTKPRAYVTLQPGYEPTDTLAEELIAFCREHMADYKRPRWIEFMAELPKTATGKIQRYRLRG